MNCDTGPLWKISLEFEHVDDGLLKRTFYIIALTVTDAEKYLRRYFGKTHIEIKLATMIYDEVDVVSFNSVSV